MVDGFNTMPFRASIALVQLQTASSRAHWRTEMTRFAVLAFLLCSLLFLPGCASPPVAASEPLDWTRVSDVDVIEVVTADEDGDVRVTKVWFVLIDDVGYLRTSSSRWLENIRRSPEVTIRIDGVDHPQIAMEVEDPALRQRVDEVSREKYGWQDSFIGAFRSGDPQVLRLAQPAP